MRAFRGFRINAFGCKIPNTPMGGKKGKEFGLRGLGIAAFARGAPIAVNNEPRIAD
jgi:hypothetical protein